MWGNLKFLHMWIKFTFLHITDVEKSEISLIMCTIYGILLNFTLFFCIFCNLRCFVVKSVCRDLRAVVWRKFDPKIVPVEKKWQISGMLSFLHRTNQNYHHVRFLIVIDHFIRHRQSFTIFAVLPPHIPQFLQNSEKIGSKRSF